MKLRSITFRCSDAQLNRVEQAMHEHKNTNRTEFISIALREFLDFSEKEDIKQLDLFALVERLDSFDSAHPFSTEA